MKMQINNINKLIIIGNRTHVNDKNRVINGKCQICLYEQEYLVCDDCITQVYDVRQSPHKICYPYFISILNNDIYNI